MKRSYLVAVLLGAGLLFLVQPMSARMLLPLLGGAPAVWNTCMVFFQASLLLGYLYAHLLTSALPARAQAAVHLMLLAAAAFLLPPALPATPPPVGRAWPMAWLLLALARSVGLPFFVLATTGPLLQRWLAGSRLAGSKDPYPLYAAGNAGSFAGLLAYPFLLERVLGLRGQTLLWSVAYLVFAILVAACAWPLLRGREQVQESEPAALAEPLSWSRRLHWLVLAFIPASLVLGVTQYLTTDVAAVPLLWVVPLSLYLLTFVVAFSPRGRRAVPPRLAGVVLTCAAVPAAVGFAVYSRPYALAFPVFHLTALAAAGLLCHGRLAEDRPSTAHLTEFYLILAAGGVMGGIFNALLAPVLFDSLLEYPLMLAAACAVRAALARRPRFPEALLDLAAPAAVVLARLAADRLLAGTFSQGAVWVWFAQVALPALVCLAFVPRGIGFALGLAALLAVAWTQGSEQTRVIHAERTFFGVTRVEERLGPPLLHPDLKRMVAVRYHVLYHGTTIHGKQALGMELRAIPTSYYHPTGPVGRVFQRLGGETRMDQIALVGLGAGTLTAYGRPGQTMTVYEIDPEVLRTASDPRLFRFLSESRAHVEVLLRDGRLGMVDAPDRRFGLLVLDAFSSDAIPVHLLTREAMAVYQRKLRQDGILALHVTNRYLDLVPVVEALARDAGLKGIVVEDQVDDARQRLEGKDSSTWVLLAADPAALGTLPTSPHARPLADAPPGQARYLWTDSFSNLFSVLKLWR